MSTIITWVGYGFRRTSAATTTVAGLGLLLTADQVGHHGPDLPGEGDRDGLVHGGVDDAAELLAGKPLLSGNKGIDMQAVIRQINKHSGWCCVCFL